MPIAAFAYLGFSGSLSHSDRNIYILYIKKNTIFKTSGSPVAGICPGPACQLLPSCSFHGLLESVTHGWARKRGGGREIGRGRVAFPPTPIFFSLLYFCHYYITLFWASKVVGTEFGSSPASLPWKARGLVLVWGFFNYYLVLKDFLLGHVPHVWSSNCSRCAWAKNLGLN